MCCDKALKPAQLRPRAEYLQIAYGVSERRASEVLTLPRAAGAAAVAGPADQFYGDRLARITDPCGNQWSIFTHIEDLTPYQVAERLAAMGEG